MNIFKRIDHVEIIPMDVQATLRFYTEVLGFRISSRHPIALPPLKEVIYLRLGDGVVEIMVVDNPGKAPDDPWLGGYRAIAIEVDDMAEAVKYLTAKGVAIARQPVDLGDSYRAEIRDPDGLAIELRQWKKPGR